MESSEKAHFVLVHGACHGAWCWYKIVDLLHKKGHAATAIDLSASGIHPADPNTVISFEEYNRPLIQFLASLEPSQKVILVGHSLGGIAITYASELFPGKFAALVYVVAGILPAALPFQEHFAKIFANLSFEFFYGNGPDHDPTSFIFVPESLKESFYNTSPPQDCVLASMLMRPNPVAAQLAPQFNITEEGHGNVPKVYIKTLKDNAFPILSQEAIVGKNKLDMVFTIDCDHSPFFSAPEELQGCLLEVQASYGAKRC